MRITRISPMSVAKLAFVMYGLIGLVIGVVFAVASLLGATLGGVVGDRSAILGAIFGVGAVVIMPLLYGCFGALGALISTAIYNVVAGLVGGIEITTEPVATVR